MLRTLDRYVIREVLVPFAIVLLVFTFMLLMDPIMVVADKLIAKGVAWSVVARVMPTLLPQALALTIPMALLIGLLVAFGRISEDREWVAMQACGISVYRLLRPVAALSVIACLVTGYVMIYSLPAANQAYREIVIPVVMSRAESDVKPRVFFQDFPGFVFYVRDVAPDGTWKDVFVSDISHGEEAIYLAQRGQMVVDRARRTVHLVLENGSQHKVSGENYLVNSFGTLSLSLDPETVFSRRELVAKGSNEMTVAELRQRSAELRKAHIPPNDEAMAIQQKFSIPFACLVFGLIGLGLGASNRKDGKMASFVLGISVIFLYWVIMYSARAAARAQVVPAWLALWIPNIVLGALAAVILIVHDRSSEGSFRLPAVRFEVSRATAMRLVARVRGGVRNFAVNSSWLPKPRILDLYVSRLYIRIVALSFAALLGLFYISEFINVADKIFKGIAKPTLVFLYFWYKTPYLVYFVIPITALIAVLVTLGILTRNSELIVMRACGISIYRVAVPMLVFGLIAGVTLFVLEENVLSTANRRWRSIQATFNGVNVPTSDMLNRGWIVSRDGRSIYHFSSFTAETNKAGKAQSGQLREIATYTFDTSTWRMVGRSFATRAVYEQNVSPGTAKWQEQDGWLRTFPESGTAEFDQFKQRNVTLEAPDYFGNEVPDAERMNYFALKRYIAELQAGGFNVTKASVDLDRKIAFPFVAVIMTLIAVPFAVTMGRRGTMYGIGLGVALALAYWVMVEVFGAFGAGGVLPPVLAAWAPNILFGVSAVYLLLTVKT